MGFVIPLIFGVWQLYMAWDADRYSADAMFWILIACLMPIYVFLTLFIMGWVIFPQLQEKQVFSSIEAVHERNIHLVYTLITTLLKMMGLGSFLTLIALFIHNRKPRKRLYRVLLVCCGVSYIFLSAYFFDTLY